MNALDASRPPQVPPRVGRYRFVVMSALWITGVFLYLDRVAMSVAAPRIMHELHLTGPEMGKERRAQAALASAPDADVPSTGGSADAVRG